MFNTKTLSTLMVAMVLILALLISGCGQNGEAIVSNEKPQLIQTYGEAEVSAEPDMAEISLEIETRGSSAEEAAEENAAMANTVRESLLEFGLSEDEISTGSYRLRTIREERPREKTQPESMDREAEEMESENEEVIYYQATNEITVSVTEIDKVGEIIDTAVAAGANRVNHITFDLEDSEELKMQALAAATEQAAQKAEAIAGGAGESISGLYSIKEERTDYRPLRIEDERAQAEMAEEDEAPTPITPDDVIVRATVVAEYTF
ncbi:MAG: SIMPL domain-containing protein [Bacillota bacterium]